MPGARTANLDTVDSVPQEGAPRIGRPAAGGTPTVPYTSPQGALKVRTGYLQVAYKWLGRLEKRGLECVEKGSERSTEPKAFATL